MKRKIIRITTVPGSLKGLLKGQLKFMSQYYEMIGVSSYHKEILEGLAEDEGVRVVPVNMTRQITPIRDLIALRQLYKLLKKEKPFIVHTHTPKAGTLGMIAAKLARVPHRFHTVAGMPLLESKGSKRKMLNFVEKLTYSCATKVYPNSKGLLEIIIDQKFCEASKLKVIGEGSSNGIDTSYFDPYLFTEKDNSLLKESLGIENDDYVFIFIGRLVADKGINELVSAFNKLSSSNEKAKLLLVGTFEEELDPLKPETRQIIDQNKRILSVGWQEDVRPFLAISNMLTFPSYREGFPNVVMQAGAMGLYSIVTDINGCNEIIIEGENGTIIPVKNEE
ncbi:MAG: glycosyltransferase family 4 protein, partial [Flavobacteriaceae bacterium]|nr:glycosyltransferase family 4 protein [Flavobacteriaceae bacterium]